MFEGGKVAKCAEQGVVRNSRQGKAKLKVSRGPQSESTQAATANDEHPRYWHDAEVLPVKTSTLLGGETLDLYDGLVS